MYELEARNFHLFSVSPITLCFRRVSVSYHPFKLQPALIRLSSGKCVKSLIVAYYRSKNNTVQRHIGILYATFNWESLVNQIWELHQWKFTHFLVHDKGSQALWKTVETLTCSYGNMYLWHIIELFKARQTTMFTPRIGFCVRRLQNSGILMFSNYLTSKIIIIDDYVNVLPYGFDFLFIF